MKHFLFMMSLCIIIMAQISLLSAQTWESNVTLGSTLTGVTSAASDGYCLHVVGVYNSAVKHFYLGNDYSIIHNNLLVSGAENPVVTNYGGQTRVIMKLGTTIATYQSMDDGTTWSSLGTFTPNVSIAHIDAYSDQWGTHIVWDNGLTYPNGQVYYLRYDDSRRGYYGFKNVTDINPGDFGARPKVTATAYKAHVVWGYLGVNSRDLDLPNETWATSYVGSSIGGFDVYLAKLGDLIYAIARGPYVLGYPQSEGTIQTAYRTADGTSWVTGPNIEEYYTEYDYYKGPMVTVANGKLYYTAYDGYQTGNHGVYTRIFDPGTGWGDPITIDITNDIVGDSPFLAGGPYGVYFIWTGSNPSTHQHARRLALVSTTTQNPSMSQGWNLASIPLDLTDFAKNTVWANSAPGPVATWDNGSYVLSSFLKTSTAYWVSYPTGQSVSYTGATINHLDIPVKEGWNMIGSLSTQINVTSITFNPPDILNSAYFYYSGSYLPASTIDPGKGYWVNVSGDGTLTMDAGSIANTTQVQNSLVPPDAPSPPAAPTLIAPLDGAQNQEVGLTLSWNPSDGADQYYLELSTSSDFSTFYERDSNLASTSKYVMLNYSSMYYWHVKAYNAAGWGAWSEAWCCSTKAYVPPPPPPCDQSYVLTPVDQLVVNDAVGHQQILYVENTSHPVDDQLIANLLEHARPLHPHEWSFKAQFDNGNIFKLMAFDNHNKQNLIRLTNASYPLTLEWNVNQSNGNVYKLVVPNVTGKGKAIVKRLTGIGAITLNAGNTDNTIPLDIEPDQIAPCDPSQTVSSDAISENVVPDKPREFSLSQNHPNPFNPSTTIEYKLKEDGLVKLLIYNILGQEVRVLIDEFQQAGYKSVNFDAGNLTSGVYYAKLIVSDTQGRQQFLSTTKLLLMK